MKPQTPAQGISVDQNFGDAKVFNVECDCSEDLHSIKMWIEINGDREVSDVEVSFYVTTWSPFYLSWRQKLKSVYDILVNGVHKQQHQMILSKQAAINLAHCITETVQELENKR